MRDRGEMGMGMSDSWEIVGVRRTNPISRNIYIPSGIPTVTPYALYARYAPQFHELAGGRASDEKQSVCMPSLLAHHEHPLTPLHVPLSYEVSQVGGGGGGFCIGLLGILSGRVSLLTPGSFVSSGKKL